MSFHNVRGLSALVAPTQQKNDDLAALDEVDAVARSMRDPKFAYAVTNGSHVSRVSKRKSLNSYCNDSSRMAIPQFTQPFRETSV
jgi:hypothetical protein